MKKKARRKKKVEPRKGRFKAIFIVVIFGIIGLLWTGRNDSQALIPQQETVINQGYEWEVYPGSIQKVVVLESGKMLVTVGSTLWFSVELNVNLIKKLGLCGKGKFIVQQITKTQTVLFNEKHDENCLLQIKKPLVVAAFKKGDVVFIVPMEGYSPYTIKIDNKLFPIKSPF